MSKTFFKKISLITLVGLLLTISSNIAFAQPKTKVNIDDIFKKSTATATATEQNTAQLNNVGALPDVSIEQGIGFAIKTVLRWSFYLTLISLVLASIYYIISMGKEDDITKARNIILYLVIGMAIIAAAYGIVSGVSRFNFFGAEMPEDPITNSQ